VHSGNRTGPTPLALRTSNEHVHRPRAVTPLGREQSPHGPRGAECSRRIPTISRRSRAQSHLSRSANRARAERPMLQHIATMDEAPSFRGNLGGTKSSNGLGRLALARVDLGTTRTKRFRRRSGPRSLTHLMPSATEKRRGWDSNPRWTKPPTTVFETGALSAKVPQTSGVFDLVGTAMGTFGRNHALSPSTMRSTPSGISTRR
jgi:hypothetical protein